MNRRSLLKIAAMTAFTAALSESSGRGQVDPATSTAEHRGGSNFGWHDLAAGCRREPYGVISGYHRDPRRISERLRAMHAAGQRRLRIPVFHKHGPDEGTFIDSTGGRMSDRSVAALAGLLAAVRATGFQEVEIGLFPGKQNSPKTWTRWEQGLYQENLGIVEHARAVVRASGLPYMLDLSNELVPPPGRPVALRCARQLWQDYTERHGTADTVGFSCIGDTERFTMLPEIYRDLAPDRLEFHFYGTRAEDERARFLSAHRTTRAAGLGSRPWVIGEVFSDDAVAAANLARAVRETGQPVHALYQWPLTRRQRCADVDTVPVSFASYAAHGF